jgi:hypothetical protein
LVIKSYYGIWLMIRYLKHEHWSKGWCVFLGAQL